MKLILITIICIYLIPISYAQNSIEKKIDSLNSLALRANDSTKYDAYNRIAFYYVFRDSIKADSVLRKSIINSSTAQDKFSQAQLINTLGILKAVHGDYDSASYYYTKSLDISLNNNYKELQARVYNNIGLSYWNNGDLSKAQDYFFKGLKISDKYLKNDAKDSYYNNIGLIYQELEEIDKAIEFHNKALLERINKKLIPEQVASHNNLGICYKIIGNYDKAKSNFKKGLQIADSTNTYREYQSIYNNLGNLLVEEKQYSNALINFKKAVTKPPNGNLDIIAQHQGYGNLGYTYLMLNKKELARRFIDRALTNLKNNSSLLKDSETLLHAASLINAMDGDMTLSKKLYDSLEDLRITRFSKENATALANYEAKYQTEKKEKEILSQRAQLAEKELEVRKKNNIAYGLGGGILVLGLLGYLFYNQQRLKNRQQAKEFELKNALVKIETQNRLQEQRLRISRDLHDNIGSQLTFITSSLDNLKYGMKDPNDQTKNKLTEIGAFAKTTINELRDTIWAINKEHITFEDLEGRLGNLLDQARTAAPETQFSLDVDKHLDRSLALTSVEGMNVYRIIQEGVNNAIKYASASRVDIMLSRKQNTLETIIKDNGKGFDVNNPALGNGLTNMTKRAKDIDAAYTIESALGSGTNIKVILPYTETRTIAV